MFATLCRQKCHSGSVELAGFFLKRMRESGRARVEAGVWQKGASAFFETRERGKRVTAGPHGRDTSVPASEHLPAVAGFVQAMGGRGE